MKKLLICLLTVTFGLSVQSQNISYSIRSDDPYDIKKTVIHLDPFYVDCWMTNINIGWGLRVDYRFNKKLNFALTFRRAYLDGNAGEHMDGNLMYAAGGLKKYIFVEPVAYYTLADYTNRASMRIVLSSSSYSYGGYTYTNTKSINVPGTARHVFSARGGLMFINNAVDFSEGDAEPDFEAVNFKDKNQKFTFGPYGKTVGGSPIYNGYTMMTMTSLFAGISYKYISNLVVDVEGWGGRRNAGLHDIYFDLMFAPVISYADMASTDKRVWEISNKNQSRIGWRVGWQYRHPVKTWMSFECAFGARPGYKGQSKGILNARAFLDLTMGISIPTNKL